MHKTTLIAATVAAATFGNFAAHAAPIPVTFAPSVAVSGAANFTADKLNLLDYSRVDLTGTTFN